ncbi:MAG: peptide chain release factor N(5)-glutamine methyltransferase [Thiocapsa sp.]|nr:peptide chain release factor N(5)-glutamine methyltransferase [Thiocapsa sp.]MCG6897699.1 peptide chain release factor N(5)-glutamine methyltransferase [Thiocapsa sp.]MCG6984826.1 peptide chain release factor N(5)-glutamine methyltransferase [Thiocapsa sp.]
MDDPPPPDSRTPSRPSAAGPHESGPRIDQILREAAAALALIPDGSPRLEAELLLSQATGWPRTHLVAWPEHRLGPEALGVFRELMARRLIGEPIAYIRGRQAFWSLDLKVTPDTLIPRPETELLVETALELLAAQRRLLVADLGTGCGAIAAALATERPDWTLFATDRSEGALRIARENLARLQLSRVVVVQAHWLRAFAAGSLDAVLSNPPYIAASDPHLTRGDLRFEPRGALSPDGDGLGACRAIASEAFRCLRPGGWLLLEHGHAQGADVRRLLTAAGLRSPRTRADFAGHDRVTWAHA